MSSDVAMTAARGSPQDVQLPPLPLELVYHIFWLASYSDYKTAHALAYVSKAVCKLTAANRWRVVAITSERQALALQRTLEQAREPDVVGPAQNMLAMRDCIDAHGIPFEWVSCHSSLKYHGAHLDIRDPSGRRTCQMTIDIIPLLDEPFTEMIISLPCDHPERFIEHLFVDIYHDWATMKHPTVFQHLRSLLPKPYFPFDWPFASQLADEEAIDWQEYTFSNLQHLSLGFDEEFTARSFWEDIGECNATEVTMVFQSYTLESEDWIGKFLSHHRVQRLHVIGIDDQSSVAGIPPPFAQLERMRAGSTRPAWQDGHLWPWGDENPPTGITHLRYDTQKFAFRPTTITANRIRPLLQEPCFPRKVPGAAEPLSLWRDPSDEAALLRSWGYGSFQRLHLVWGVDANQDASPSTSAPAADSGGGWPAEAHDVWTDTTVPSATADGLAIDDGTADSFAAELQDAIWGAFGWRGTQRDTHVPQQGDLHYDLLSPHAPSVDTGYFERIAQGYTDTDRSALTSLRARLRREMPQLTPFRCDELQYGVRAPSTLMKLGGVKGAFTRRQRLELFFDRAYGGEGAWATK